MIPFDIICKSCGSHNVDVIASGVAALAIFCVDCGCCLCDISYNPTKYLNYKKMILQGGQNK